MAQSRESKIATWIIVGIVALVLWNHYQDSQNEAAAQAARQAKEAEEAKYRFMWTPSDNLAFSSCAIFQAARGGVTYGDVTRACLPSHVDPVNVSYVAECLQAALSWSPGNPSELANRMEECIGHGEPDPADFN